LITACSTGLGRELALAALASGFRIIATARRVEKLDDLENRGAKTLPLDVTWSIENLVAFAVDYLANNAGYAQGGAIEEVSPKEALEQFNTNFFGLVNTTNAFLPHFHSRRAGTLVNLSSEITCHPLPGAGLYCASKAALDAAHGRRRRKHLLSCRSSAVPHSAREEEEVAQSPAKLQLLVQ
ncbi:hypothetical protein B0H13DRAFT_1606821, partial [Mycena leptocephala]